MSSVAQIDANRRNAQLSTGPLSAEGKARVAHNAPKHTLCSTHILVLPDQQEEFETFQSALGAEIKPKGVIELQLFDDLLRSRWNMIRCSRLEASLQTGAVDPFLDPSHAANLARIQSYLAPTSAPTTGPSRSSGLCRQTAPCARPSSEIFPTRPASPV